MDRCEIRQIKTDASRNTREVTIVHEMVHGLMDEALTNGMIDVIMQRAILHACILDIWQEEV